MKITKNKSQIIGGHEVEEQDHYEVEELDRSSVLELFTKVADKEAKLAFFKKQIEESQPIELQNGKTTSILEERNRYRKIFEDIPQVYEPKFSRFFDEFGKMMGWSEEKLKVYHKPHIVPQTINEVVYSRFPKEVVLHIQTKNPYIKWCTRAHKNYLFLSEDGILLLERFIDDAVCIIQESTSYYDFRMKHAKRFGTGFQPVLFEEYYQ
ncbi:MAG: P63C domain-containing protein [Bacilli bacterium]|jgi:hypothetical protein